jgi:phage tail protein X
MSVSTRSRYFTLAPETLVTEDGQTTYLPMRPEPPLPATKVDLRLTGDDTLESLAHRYYGRSDAWWYIADANPLIFPLDWRPGAAITLPQGGGVGRVLRTRRF